MHARLFLAMQATEEEESARREKERHDKRIARALISDLLFVQRYRLTKEGFEYLCGVLSGHVKSTQRVSLRTKVLCALLFYANGDYQRVVGVANAFSQEAVSRFISEVTEALNHPRVLAQFIKFPIEREERDAIKERFYRAYKFPGVIGCVDGCHFRIFKPKREEEHLYYCRKHYHSLNVQMVSDEKTKILSLNPKFGGATRDAFIWENSQINSYMQSLHQTGETACNLGDSGYPQRPWLMTPYGSTVPGSIEEAYNKAHSRARVNIENTFGRLKNKWRCLCKDRVLHYDPVKCAKIITACCALHNLAIDFRVPDPETGAQIEPAYNRVEVVQPDDAPLLVLGRAMRHRVAAVVHSSQREQ